MLLLYPAGSVRHNSASDCFAPWTTSYLPSADVLLENHLPSDCGEVLHWRNRERVRTNMNQYLELIENEKAGQRVTEFVSHHQDGGRGSVALGHSLDEHPFLSDVVGSGDRRR